MSNQLSTPEKILYFPSLNGIRFIAALMVIVHHVEQFKAIFGKGNLYHHPSILKMGGLGVTLFFVLSGYLITMLLLIEKSVHGDINIKKFYFRRILRIWPLYYLWTFISFLIIPLLITMPGTESPYSELGAKLGLFTFMLPNVSLILFHTVPFAAHLWSVGVEEQFYLIWPNLLKNTNKILFFLLLIIVALFSLRNGIGYLIFHNYFDGNSQKYFKAIAIFLNFFKIDSMAIGGIGAWVVFKKKDTLLKVLFNKPLQLITYLLLLYGLFRGWDFNAFYFNHILYSLAFMIILLNLSVNKNTILSFENKFFNYLGKISYGLYVFHAIAIVVVLKFLMKYSTIENDLVFNGILYIGAFVLSILMAGASYKFIEFKFLKFKNKFAIVKSGSV